MAAMWHLKLDGMNYGLLLVATHYKKGRTKKSFGPGSFLLGEEKNNKKRAWNQERERERERKKEDFCFGGRARNETTQFYVFFEVYGKCTNQREFVTLGLEKYYKHT